MLEQFYADILISGSQSVVATLDGKKITHYILDDNSELIPFLSQFQEVNTYHSLGAYEGLKTGVAGKGELKNLQGCTGVRAFAFDLDVGEKKGEYDSLEDAYQALADAVEQGHCPEPTWTMYSGGGLQLYFVIGGKQYASGLSEELWTACFRAIRAQLKPHLKLDPTVGSHPYRLLRSPCTPNWKYAEPVMPVILNEERGPYITADWIKSLKPAKPKAVSKDNGEHRVENPVALKQVKRACAAIRHEAETGGAETSEPVWLATANICAHTFEYRMAFHELSSLHPEYSKEDTDEKFNHVTQNVASGPMSCEHFGDPTDPESACHGCWAAKQGLPNPISAARNYTPTPPTLPGKAVRKRDTSDPDDRSPVTDLSDEAVSALDEVADSIEDDGITYTEDGEKVIHGIIEGQLPPDWNTDGVWLHGPKGEVCAHFLVKPFQFNDDSEEGNILISKDGQKYYAIPANKLGTPAGIVGELSNLGVLILDDKLTLQYVRQAAMTRRQIKEFSSFGWADDFDAFYTPSTVIGEHDAGLSARLQKITRIWGHEKGTLEDWLKAVQIYGKKGQEPYLMMLLASLASPLLSYYDLERGVILSLTGVGGAGKTSALKAASSVWGRGVPSLVGTASTPVALRAATAQCGHLPMIYDDITQMAAEDIKQLALEISQGSGRARGNVDGSLQAMESWHLAFLTTSNLSIHAKLAELVDQGSADMNRVIELPIRPSENVSNREGGEMLTMLQDNYGHAGKALIENVILLDRDKEIKKIRKLLDQLRARDGLKGHDRFVDNLIIACYDAHRKIKALYPEFPGKPETQLTWMREQLRENNKAIEMVLSIRVPEVDDFIIAYAVEDLILQKTATGYAKQGNSMKGYIYDHGEHYLIPRDVFNGWCRRNNLQMRTVLEKWGFEGRIVNQAATGNQKRWSGKFRDGIIMEGLKSYPNVIIARKTHGTVAALTDGKSGNVTPIGKAVDYK